MSEDRIRLDTLPNGLRVVTERMPSLASAAVCLGVGAGSRDERAAESGLSHMLEHMAFKGTGRRSARRIVEEIEDVGGDLNAYTDVEGTVYQARVLAEHVPLALDLLADILRDSRLTEEDVARERDVILQEIGERMDVPAHYAFELLQERAFPGQPLGRPVIGSRETVSSFRSATVRRWMDRHYGPANMILAVAGAVDHDAVMRDAARLFADMPAAEGAPREAATYRGGHERLVRDVEQAHVCLGLPAPPASAFEASVRTQALCMVLGGGMSSRLFQEAREERGLCYSIYAYSEAFEDAGLMTIYAASAPERAAETAALSMDVLRRTADDLTPAEADRARAQAKAGRVMALESPMRRAESLIRQVQLRGRPLPLAEIEAALEGADATSLREAARAALEAGPVSAVYLGPEGGALPEVLAA